MKPLLEVTREIWYHVLDVNLTGAFSVLAAAAIMVAQGRGGRIVNRAS